MPGPLARAGEGGHARARRRQEGSQMNDRPPLPPFTHNTAAQKVQAAEDAWNTRDPERLAQPYSKASVWRNSDQFLTGRPAIIAFITQKWKPELDYELRNSRWTFEDNRTAVRFQYES